MLNIHSRERIVLALASGLLLLGMFLHLGMQPLYLEEPRRALIAMEMQERGDYWTPTELGKLYYNKPPLFNWALIGSARLLGGFHEWAMRLPTVLAAIGMAWLLFASGRRYVDAGFGWTSGLMFVACGSVLLFFSHLGEIDLFYALLSLAGFATLFHYSMQEHYLPMFVGFYGLHALGVLTKGLPSVVFIALTLPAWLAYIGQWRRLFSWAHLAGIAVFAAVVGGYLHQYNLRHPAEDLLRVWAGQAGERTVAEQGWGPLLRHFILYPLDSLKDLLPFSLLIVFAVRRDLVSLIRRNAWVAFAALTFAVNFPVYWLSPGSRQRYLYMLFPLLLVVLAWAWRHASELQPWRSKLFRAVVGVFITLLALGAPAIGWIPELAFLPGRWLLAAGFSLALAGIAWQYWRSRGLELPLLILSMALLRLAFDCTILPQRAHDSDAQRDKAAAAEITRLTGNAPLYLWQDDHLSFTTVYYLNRLRGRCLTRTYAPEPSAVYIAEAAAVQAPHEELYRFSSGSRQYVVFRFAN